MSLKKKIALSFLISVFIIATLISFEYINFIEIKKEIRHLEITDTIRSKSLQLRRHEKNFFLSPLQAKEESEAIHKYLLELNSILTESYSTDKLGKLSSNLKACIKEYEYSFNIIESSVKDLLKEFEKTKTSYTKSDKFLPLIGSTLIEHPLQGIEILKKVFLIPSDNKLISELRELDTRVNILRKNGEDILITSEEIDKIARKNVDNTIYLSQLAIIIFSPLLSGHLRRRRKIMR